MSFVEAGERRRAGLIAAALIAMTCALALPAVAGAEQYEVNGTADEPAVVVGVCASAGGKCTLRAAIQASNSTVEDDSIVFDETVFEGQLADTIALSGSGLPPITDKVLILGRQCTTEAGVSGPCQGISGPNASSSALTIENTNQVEIEGLAVTGARTGINISGGSEEVRIRGSWLGMKLDGGDGGNETGIFIDPESNGNLIGGESAEARNVFAYNDADGLQILGADNAIVLGNYFGVEPDGVTPAVNGENIEVGSQLAGGFVASGNLIGVQAESKAAETEECDRGCNVIAGATASGVDLQGNSLQGESPAVGTHVAGNFIGLAADGTTVVPNALVGVEGAAGIKVGAAAKTLIGGLEEDESEANLIAGGAMGIYQENSDDLEVLGNEFGFNPGASRVDAPALAMHIFGNTSTEAATIEGNAIGLDAGGTGIEQKFRGATIASNFFVGGQTAILSTITGPTGNLIEGNLIDGAEVNGILLMSNENDVFGNEVFNSGAAGIRVQNSGPAFFLGTTDNRIGGDSEAAENVISESGGDAIEIVNGEGTFNEVGRNNGSDNAGLFINLLATSPGTEPLGPNGGIKPPVIAAATKTEASGSAEADALVRVFRKASPESGELAAFLGEAFADGSGKWKVTYTVPGGTIVAATQTNEEGGTSELATASVPVDPPVTCADTPAAAMCVRPDPPTPPAPPLCPQATGCVPLPPQTTITKGPKAKSTKTTAKFKFTSSVAGSSFECKLDGKPFKKCKSPKQYKNLKLGKHVFKVRAVKGAGNIDPTPAKRKFTVLG